MIWESMLIIKIGIKEPAFSKCQISRVFGTICQIEISETNISDITCSWFPETPTEEMLEYHFLLLKSDLHIPHIYSECGMEKVTVERRKVTNTSLAWWTK